MAVEENSTDSPDRARILQSGDEIDLMSPSFAVISSQGTSVKDEPHT